jgi:Cdc6-like AAA superfamily ATPase
MLNKKLRFPSGKTVDQVKKDAKRLAKERGMPLHMALDLCAREEGIEECWTRAIAILQKEYSLIWQLQLPLHREDRASQRFRAIEIRPDASTIIIVGRAGSGKSVLAMKLAQQALSMITGQIHYMTPENDLPRDITRNSFGDDSIDNDLAMRLLRQLLADHPSRVRAHGMDNIRAIDTAIESLPSGSLIILDEAASLRVSASEFFELTNRAAVNGQFLIVSGQSFDFLFQESAPENLKDLTKHIGGIFLGRQFIAEDLQIAPMPIRNMIEASNHLPTQQSTHSFVVGTMKPLWKGIVSF